MIEIDHLVVSLPVGVTPQVKTQHQPQNNKKKKKCTIFLIFREGNIIKTENVQKKLRVVIR